ncbi:heat shock factor protein 3-like [Protopterus annectens]|uniref:heat shock factor protein 3-like n=1 Tax=Protopterus annectens TaxID=7888 RepID=UPI001CFA4774|nr:heat shock factor protein 3-like [Protopterus annectens]
MNQNSSNVPAFLVKLWALVEDSTTNDVITWSGNGQNFRVLNEHKFAKEILPLYFKHSNMSSFVRQLNMYGFRKVVSLEGGLIRHAEDLMEFHHPFFIQGEEKLLENIKRKVSSVKIEETKMSPSELHDVLLDVQQMKGKQDNFDVKLADLKRENQILWREVASLRQRHAEQQNLLNKVIRFIIGLLQTKVSLRVKRKRPLMFSLAGPRPPKQSRQCVSKKSETTAEGNRLVLNNAHDVSETGLVIQDVTNSQEQCTEEKSLAIQTEGTVHNGMKHHNQVNKILVSCDEEVTSESNTLTGAKCYTSEGSWAPITPKEILAVHSPSIENQDLILEAILNGNSAPTQNVCLIDRDSVSGLMQVIPACEISHTEVVEEKNVPSTTAAALSSTAKDSGLNNATEGILVPSGSTEDAGSVIDSILNENIARTNEFTLDR